MLVAGASPLLTWKNSGSSRPDPVQPSLPAPEQLPSTSHPPGETTESAPPRSRHHLRRRRPREPSPDQIENAELGSDNTGEGTADRSRSRKEDEPPSPKRRRVTDFTMRPDGVSNTNGFSPISNGTANSAIRKPAVSASIPSPSESALINGNGKDSSNPLSSTYFGHSREEVTRILIQSLHELGYSQAAETLTNESRYELESPGVTQLRNAVLEGHWTEAENILLSASEYEGPDFVSSNPSYGQQGLVLARDANVNEMLFCLRQQKFLELLDQHDLPAALMVLRHELTPLNHDTAQLHALSSLLMCPPQYSRTPANWDQSVRESRRRLLAELTKSISPSVLIPDHRLATLLDHVKQTQINQCIYHNTVDSPSLYSDHVCDRSQFPLRTTYELNQHTDEVWYLEFSHDGSKLATASKDGTVVIYNTTSFDVIHRLTDHTQPVAYATWSPDDTMLISCAQDFKAILWDVEAGHSLLTINHHSQPVSCAAWAPDGQSFVTGSLDIKSQLCHWNTKGDALYSWNEQYRVRDCAVSPDGRRLIAISTNKKIYVYNFITHVEEYSILLKPEPTCIKISKDSRYMLVNMSSGDIKLLDIETRQLARQFRGQKQGNFIIRSSFGGAAENFIVSGSEDSKIYIWHKENSMLVEALDGHTSGCVNAVAWNPKDPGMFASAGDDRKVRIWMKDPSFAGDGRSRRSLKSTSSNGALSTSRRST
ncbi:hypothetical protein FQN57_000669 [Myotisia sp. PD_48]|nr:hypothetical protein FQN57_000669 [Myotisia sp. PD_48]